MKFLNGKTLLITGGTGSFGNAATKYILKNLRIKKLIIFSRDENKQYLMQQKFIDKRLRFFLGDIRDEERLIMAFRDVDYVINAAAQKHVPIAEYNPFECVKTNIYGSQSIISASMKTGVKRVLSLSTDKACNPINLYGATKLCSEKLFINANKLAAPNGTKYGIVRYGNVIASRGSVIPLFKTLLQNKKIIPLTDKDMTRFFITLEEAVKFVLNCLLNLRNGELFIPKMNSIYIKDLIKILDPNAKIKIVGIRPGEKIHEILCSKDELGTIYECKNYIIIYPIDFNKKKIGKKIKNSFNYSSDSKEFLNKEKIKILLKKSKILL